MSVANILVNLAASAGGGGVVVAIINGIFNRDGQRAQAAKLESDRWFQEAETNYAKVQKQCDDCRSELADAKREHAEQMKAIRRELADVKDALIRRVDVVDEVLPYVEGLPEDKLRDLRAENQAVKFAIIRSRP